jgi:hypothetical protein
MGGGCAVGPHEQARALLRYLLGWSLFAEVLFWASSFDISDLLSLLGLGPIRPMIPIGFRSYAT